MTRRASRKATTKPRQGKTRRHTARGKPGHVAFSIKGLLLKLLLVLLVIAGVGLIYSDARITATFSDRMWQLPARVFARPLELFAGADLTSEQLLGELQLLGYRTANSVRDPGQFNRADDGDASRFEVYSRGFQFPLQVEPARRITVLLRAGRVASLRSSSGAVDLMRLEPLQVGGVYPSHGEDRLLARLGDAPETLVAALLAVEDRDFYDHWGISPKGIARALVSNVRSGQVVAGGSTITQQLVKNYYLSPERTFSRKLQEVVMAMLLELHYGKDKILEGYLNEIYLGQEGPRAIHGFGLAARHYFDRPLQELGVHQQALLVGMIKGPSLYNPRRNPERATERRNVVLQVMADQGIITREHALIAGAMPLGLQDNTRSRESYPGYLDLVRRQLRREYRDKDLSTRGLRIFTAFDPHLQRELERSVAQVVAGLPGAAKLEAAAVATRFDTGEVVALVGGRQVRYAGFNRALDSRRPAGSLLKPAVYLAALEQPGRYTLATLLDDSSLEVPTPNGDIWRPRNFDRESHGAVPLHRALSRSYNLASARLGLELGLPVIVDILQRLGIERPLPEVPALILGAGEYSPMDIAAMYQTIAAGGFRLPMRSIRDVLDADGEPLARYPLHYDRSVSLQATHLLQYALREVVQEGTGRGALRVLPPGFSVAGKTGTTNEGRDAWFAGFSGDLLAVTWVGRDDNGATGLTGASGALPVWSRFMTRASRRPLAYRMPDGVETHYVEDSSGLPTGEGCAGSRLLPFIVGSEPDRKTSCSEQSYRGIRGWFESLFGGKDK